jgi:heavy metal sensor kinase
MSLPIRIRLTAFYAVLLSVIVVGLGAFLVLELRSDLQARIDRDLQAASAQIAEAYAEEGNGRFLDVAETVLPRTGSAAQVRDATGRLLLSYGDVPGGERLLPSGTLEAALRRGPTTRTVTVSGIAREQRFLTRIAPVRRLGRPRVVIVAESLLEVDESVGRVLVLLLIAGPAALVAMALGGWWLARSALLPLRRMTAEAQEIGIDRLRDRVAVPRVADEIGQLAVTFNAMLERLQRGVEDQQRFVADASHELRSPLAVMRSEIDVTLRHDELAPQARAVLESAREEVDRMSRTVAGLLTLAQADEGRLDLLTTRLDLGDAIEAAARPLRPMAATAHVRLEVHAARCPALADPNLVHQALTNLIENAIKFSPPGGRVAVTAWSRDEEVGVTVTDDGPGIPAEAQAHLFDRFYRADPARGRAVGGSGLGLAICREIAGAHGGRVWVDSRPGRGSAFSLALPRLREPARPVSAPA